MKIMHTASCCVVFIFLFTFSIAYAKKILLTGGAGFIGSHVAQKLLERGDSGVIVDNMNDGYDRCIKEHNLSVVLQADQDNQCTVYAIDICDEKAMEIVFTQENPDIICH